MRNLFKSLVLLLCFTVVGVASSFASDAETENKAPPGVETLDITTTFTFTSDQIVTISSDVLQLSTEQTGISVVTHENKSTQNTIAYIVKEDKYRYRKAYNKNYPVDDILLDRDSYIRPVHWVMRC